MIRRALHRRIARLSPFTYFTATDQPNPRRSPRFDILPSQLGIPPGPVCRPDPRFGDSYIELPREFFSVRLPGVFVLPISGLLPKPVSLLAELDP